MARRLGVGVIGLGRCWQRYRRALARLHGQMELRAVCDQVQQRAESVADGLGCAAAVGPAELIDRRDVDVLLLLDPQWFGLWPIEHACRSGRPVFCAASLLDDEAHAAALHEQVQGSGVPVFMDLPHLLAPAADRMAELLEGPLGPLRAVHAVQSLPAGAAGLSTDQLLCAPSLLGLLALTTRLFKAAPASVSAHAAGAGAMAALHLELPGGRAAQLCLWADQGLPYRCRVEGAGQGSVMAYLPRRLSWSQGSRRHALRVCTRDRETRLLQRFVECLHQGLAPEPSFADAYQALTWLRAARQSAREGRRIVLAGEAGGAQAGS